jgi:DNA-binding transcriptional LysR family regulator
MEEPMRGSLVPAVLRYVDQVARSGSIQRAAKELNIAASAIDRQILALERELGVALFERISKGMRLTPAGDNVVTLTRRWGADERRTAVELQQLQGINQGHVRLVAMDSHTNGFLPRVVTELARDYPRISLDIQIANTDEAQAALLVGSADIIAAFNLPPHRDMHMMWRRELPFGCAVAPTHPLAGRETVSLQEVVVYPIALQNKMLAIRRHLEARHGWLLAGGQNMMETNSLQLVKLLARGGDYVAFTSELDAAPEILANMLTFIPVRDRGAEPQTVSLAIDGRKPLSKVARIVAEQLAQAMDDELQQVREKLRG